MIVLIFVSGHGHNVLWLSLTMVRAPELCFEPTCLTQYLGGTCTKLRVQRCSAKGFGRTVQLNTFASREISSAHLGVSFLCRCTLWESVSALLSLTPQTHSVIETLSVL